MDSLRIGIVLNYKRAEKKKDELLNINSKKMKWLAFAKEKYSHGGAVHSKMLIRKGDKLFVPDDVAIGLYIESHYPGITIDYINPDEISTSRFKKNHLVFIIIYDLLESFHLSDKSKFIKFKNALKNSKNVYPPYEYQKFINNKCTYYKYLSNKHIPVAPTYCLTKEKWYSRNPDKYVTNLLSKIKHNKWESVVAKPVYGQESIDFAKFMKCENQNKESLNCNKNSMMKYFSRVLPKYKSIVIQEYIKGFDKSNPEFRTFFINGKYMYMIVTTDVRVDAPKQEGGKFNIPDKIYNYVLSFTREVMSSLPKLDLDSEFKNPIVTRIDIGSGLEGVPYELFVNEIEFVPSLYAEELNPDVYPVIGTIAESLVEVAGKYMEYPELPVKVIF